MLEFIFYLGLKAEPDLCAARITFSEIIRESVKTGEETFLAFEFIPVAGINNLLIFNSA